MPSWIRAAGLPLRIPRKVLKILIILNQLRMRKAWPVERGTVSGAIGDSAMVVTVGWGR